MRVPPPGSLKLDRRILLQDVRTRLSEALPHYANTEDDPTDPGWLLLEQAAWMVELLSEQLDRYPFSVVQHFVHMMGGHLRPAQPAVGVIVAEVSSEGVLELDDRRPSPWRFFTPQDEEMESVEFCPAESGVPLRQGWFFSACEIAADELFLVGPTELGSGLAALACWRAPRRRSGLFVREQVHYDVVTNNAETLLEALNNALTLLAERQLGWLKFEILQVSRERLRLVARIEPAGAFERTAPGGIAVGGDLEGDWGMLDGTTWTPSVTIRRHPMLPSHLHDQFPLPGFEEGQILITDVPENFPVAELLERRAAPIPETVVEAIWKTLGNLDSRLATIRPITRVVIAPPVKEEEDLEPEWVAGALSSGVWSELARNQPKTVFHVRLAQASKDATKIRLALVYEMPHTAKLPDLQAFGVQEDGGVDRAALSFTEVWRLPLPPWEEGQAMPTVAAYDVTVRAGHNGLLLATTGDVDAALLNAMLVVNAPAVADGRTLTVQRNTPAAYNLLYENIVDRSVMDQLLEEPIPTGAASLLRKLPLSYFPVAEQEAMRDYAGVQLDPAEGTMVINAPDAVGGFRPFRPGARVRFEWYRRTLGARGNRPPGNVRLSEQPSTIEPRIYAVINPLGTFFGADRETPEAAVDRMFGPSEGTPVMAADYERLVRQVLGNRGQDWAVRCWTYAERSLVTTAFWPFPRAGEEPDPEVTRVREELAGAGPETLLVVLGPTNEIIDDEDLDWARRAVVRLVERWSRRMPTVKRAIVARFWPLRLALHDDRPEPMVPTFDLDYMDGELTDVRGRPAGERPRAVLLLNAAVTSVRREIPDEEDDL
ncbi:MAG TPA: hypothetical protein PKA64_00110 [Myxococcota bacterium]|nr:hypothetical protein [Myxococcota bacterium]